jgi:peptidoglycan/xylan/chitin deacetylase (PgdA/CDA1 family)
VHTMQKGGVFFGAHTMTHPSVSQLDSRALQEELVQSRDGLSAGLQTSIEDFAYPFGKPSDCSMAAEEVLSQAGYRSAATTTAGRNTAATNPFRLRRMQISDDPSIPSFGFNLARMLLEGDSISQEGIAGLPADKSNAVLQQKNSGRF